MAPKDLRYATVHKTREKGRVVKVETRVIFGRRADDFVALEISSLGARYSHYRKDIPMTTTANPRVPAAERIAVRCVDSDGTVRWSIDLHDRLTSAPAVTPGGDTLIILNGPIIKQLDFNFAGGVLRVGRQANSSVGRFLRLFIRNVAMVFDAYLKNPQKVTYSKTV